MKHIFITLVFVALLLGFVGVSHASYVWQTTQPNSYLSINDWYSRFPGGMMWHQARVDSILSAGLSFTGSVSTDTTGWSALFAGNIGSTATNTAVDTSGFGPLLFATRTAATNAAMDTSGYGTSFGGNIADIVANTLADTTGYGTSFGGNVESIVTNTATDTTGYGPLIFNTATTATNAGVDTSGYGPLTYAASQDTTGYGASLGGNIAVLAADMAALKSNTATRLTSIDSVLANVISVTHVQGCSTIDSFTIAAGATHTGLSVWTSGLYDQKSLFVERTTSGAIGTTDTLYVVLGYDPTVAGAQAYCNDSTLAFALGPQAHVVIPLPIFYTPYLRTLVRNTSASLVAFFINACGKGNTGN